MQHIVKPLLRHPLTPVLVILQVALACAIACNALFLLQQKLGPILATDGIGDPAHLVFLYNIAARGTPWPAARLREVETVLQSTPGVDSVSYAASLPMLSVSLMDGKVYGANHVKADAMVYTGDDLVRTLGLKLVAGRNFTPSEKFATLGSDMGFHAQEPVIITRALADLLFPDGHALGRVVPFGLKPDDGSGVVVGVIAHLIRNQFGQDNSDLDYTMLFPGVANQWPMPMFAVRVTGSNVPHECNSLTAVIQHQLGAQMLPGYEVHCRSYSSMRDDMLAAPRAAVWLLSGVTLIVLIVTLTGIMGMTGYWVQQRTRSIGIKRALGAGRSNVMRELLIENLLVVGAGVIVGLIAAYGINLWLMHHYELSRLPLTYLPFGALLLLVLGQLAVLMPARRAANIPPIVATRAI